MALCDTKFSVLRYVHLNPPNLKTKATINYAQHSDIYMKAALRRDELTLGDAYHLCQPSPC